MVVAKSAFEDIKFPQQPICDFYRRAACIPSDINEHLQTLMTFARMVDHVTEFGTGKMVSTAGLLRAFPRTLVSYDLSRPQYIDKMLTLARMAGTDFRFVQADVTEIEIAPTDMLLIDTIHNCNQLAAELERHAEKVKRFIFVHDTVTFAKSDETGGGPGLKKAMDDYFGDRGGRWKMVNEWKNNNGLTLFMRRGTFSHS